MFVRYQANQLKTKERIDQLNERAQLYEFFDELDDVRMHNNIT